MKSAMLAAEAVLAVLEESGTVVECAKEASTYTALFQQSWLYQELHAARNIRPSFKWGMWAAFAYTGLEQYVLKGRTPWTIAHHGTDYGALKKRHNVSRLFIPSPMGY